MKKQTSIRDRVAAAAAEAEPAVKVPRGISFHEFMHKHASVKVGTKFLPYSTAGREPLLMVIGVIDRVLGNSTAYLSPAERVAMFGTDSERADGPVADACLDVCGGAQFGKTIIGLHLKAYLAAVRGCNTYYALPDDDLVQGIVDGKERPEVIDQIPWLAAMAKVGKALNASGKAADRKGAMLLTDGTTTAMSYMRGINAKVPTTFSADCVIEDEKDDIKDANARFLEGRMTASLLRFHVTIGTQRYHGAGQNLKFEEGTQHVGYLVCPACGAKHNPEESWPKICRLEVGHLGIDPWLTPEGDFLDNAGGRHAFSPTGKYYFACPDCGQGLDRTQIAYEARRPERVAARKWSVRVSQLCCSGLPVIMFAQSWQNAVRDPDSMKAFSCDRLAIPKSTAQAVTPEVLHRATTLSPVFLSLAPSPEGRVRFCGLDTGDRCWFTCRELDTATGRKATVWAESIAAESVRSRVPALFATLGASCLFVDAGPLRDLARDLCLLLNGIQPEIHGAGGFDLGGRIDLGAVTWDGARRVWTGLRCAAVEFTGKPGSGIAQACRLTPANSSFYPVVSCNRDEAIGMAVDELLTASEGVQVVGADGRLRSEPLWLLPADVPGAQPIVATLHSHILSGARKERDATGREEHYIDQVENHLLLASAYARVAEAVASDAATRGGSCGAGRVHAADGHPLDGNGNTFGGPLL
jgi:hypothetical protein